ncbi:MAG: hypothetical protein DMF64_17475 [Acidobacteria bacterium]|nr:MAG: hypothetical protein DMF64_17475 [Acidobacteriota bacterium]
MSSNRAADFTGAGAEQAQRVRKEQLILKFQILNLTSRTRSVPLCAIFALAPVRLICAHKIWTQTRTWRTHVASW